MKVALVHDWLTGMRGGERVLEVFCELFPEAPIFTLFHFKDQISDIIEKHPIIASRLQYLPFKRSQYRKYLPLFPSAIESFDLREFDVIVSTSHAVAKGAIPGENAQSICYCHTPMRYIWEMFEQYFPKNRSSNLVRYSAHLVRKYLQTWDLKSTSRVDHFIANSRYVAQRIQNTYQRESEVIPPPIDCSFYTQGTEERRNDHYLIVSALVPYKKVELAVEAFRNLDRKLVIIGSGTQKKALEKHKPDNVEVKGFLSDQEVLDHYRHCKALIFPGIEDFGLTPLEAQACGAPVIAYAEGGVLESVVQNISGHFFHEQSCSALTEAIESFEKLEFSPDVMRQRALLFDRSVMIERLCKFFENLEIPTSKSITGGASAC